jgi:hypothetical protein
MKSQNSHLILEGVAEWRTLKYTKAQVPSYTPATRIGGVDGQPDRVAATAEEKEEVFIAQAFLRQTRHKEKIEVLNTRVNVSAGSIREALFAQSVKC